MNAAAIVRTIEASGGRLSIEGEALEIEATGDVRTPAHPAKPESDSFACCGATGTPGNVHLACGKAAWRRAWRGDALPADAQAAP